MSQDNRTLYDVGSSLAKLELFLQATKTASFYSTEYETTIYIMSDGSKWCKDEEGFWMEVIL